MDYFARDFQDVDSVTDLTAFIRCLKLQQSLPSYQHYKRKTFEKMQLTPGATVLEVGCGTGDDAIALAHLIGETGRVTAVDRSFAMLHQARQQAAPLSLPIDFVMADAQSLPFANQSFAAARVDRTLQHISQPQTVLQEMTRVVAQGGRVVALEPDWGTFIINSEQRQVTRQLLDFWCDSFPSGWVGRYLPQYFQQVGLIDIEIEPITIVLKQWDLADEILSLAKTAQQAEAQGLLEPEQMENWLTELCQADPQDHFFCSFTTFLVSGQKP